MLASENTAGTSDDALGRPQLGSLSADGFTGIAYDPSASTGHQITSATVAGSTVAWVETTSTDLFNFDWRVYVARLGKQGRTLVGDSGSVFGRAPLAPVFGQTRPTLARGHVFWAATRPGGTAHDASIWQARPGGGAPAVVVKRGWLPSGAGRDLFYVRAGAGGDEIVRHTASGSTDQVAGIDRSEGQVTALAASTTHLAWVVARGEDSAELHVMQLASGAECRIALHHPGADTMFLDVERDRVSWGSGSVEGDAGEYLFDAGAKELWKLGEASGYSVTYLGPGLVAWAELRPSPDGPPRARFRVARW